MSLLQEAISISIDSINNLGVCHTCRNGGIFTQKNFQEAWSSRGFSYITTLNQIQESTDKEQCRWCMKVLLPAVKNLNKERIVKVTITFRSTSAHDVATPKGVLTLRLGINDIPHSVYYVYTDGDDPSAPHIIARSRILQLNALSTRKLAVDCIQKCIHTHQRCRAIICLHSNDPILPTRVIDCSDLERVKLHLNTTNERAPYVALSYVWGEPQPHCTTTQNLDIYLVGIDSNLLPQTISDAIASTRSLGLRYLWVDALCILQDSREDKNREISRMRYIFQNAYLTIIAACAHKVSDGFLQDRLEPVDDIRHLPFPMPCVDDTTSSQSVIGRMSLSPVWLQYDASSEPVNQRAWCLEERLLSPRSLVYASHTLQYHCQTSVVNVGGSVCGPLIGQRLPDLLFLPESELALPLSKNDERTLCWSWLEVLGDYTQREVTKAGDKLVAFAAIAEQFHRLWRTDYIAGLWRETLLRDVLWYKNYETRYPRPEKYRAPSWSWAAVDGHVLAFMMDERLDMESGEIETCEILSCGISLANEDFAFGKVTSGTLTMRGVKRKAIWNPDTLMPDLWLTDSDTGKLHVGNAYPDSTEDVQNVWVIPVRWNRQAKYAAGLILTCETNGRYRRVGYFHSPEDVTTLAWIEQEKAVNLVIV
ncbi:hypothetical protein VNI00_013114 [Paramarasmius palmivorus]|uniref:Heterokaryon incompatibility domain-containing protein n=1 Tax=Paramarasmius palmivorus TaxID=297713 RepID=A0AAW0BZE9_9AGAR